MSFVVLQTLIIAGLLTYSLCVVARKLAPEAMRRLLRQLSAWLDRPSRAPVVRRIGRWLQPVQLRAEGCSSGDGCDTCGGCTPAPYVEANNPMPLNMRPRKPS